ncbi:hypothetical protein M8J76_010692 [Diaphorina citri]|nr:hypothetical protein M8J76_010692 [Diaphorina citri]
MSRKGCTRFNYSEQNMNLAVEAMKAGSSAKAAARQYGVPRTTLTDKFKGKSPRSRRMGPSPVLTDIEELEVVQWIMNMNSAGFPVTRNLIVETVSKLIIELGRPNTFKDNVPGRSWFNSFTRRHPSLNQVITRNTGDLTTEKLIQWRQQLSTYLEKHNLLHVIRQPTRVFNSREAAFCLCPSKSTQMVVRRNFKYTSNLNEEKDYLTIQLTGNADGMLAPPLLIVPYERMPLAMGRSIPGSWMIGKASSGWKTSEIFLDYISNGFLPWLQKKQIELPVTLFVDGHASHSSMALGKFCKEHGIYLISLSPNYADIVQPMDVAVFKTLRTTWKKALTRWKSEHGRTFKRTDFAALIDSVIKDTVTPDILQSGFEKCGIVPWNVDNVDFTQCPDLVKNVSSATLSSQLVNFLEEFIYPETVSLFEEYEHSDDWQTGLAVEDYSLFELWRKLKSKVKRNEENISFSEEEEDEDGGEDNSSDYD